MRRVVGVVALLLLVSALVVGCRDEATRGSLRWGAPESATAHGEGWVLGLAITAAPLDQGVRVRAVASIENTLTVELDLVDGTSTRVLAVDAASGRVVVDSGDAAREALADVPKDVQLPDSETLQGDGSVGRSETTYEFTLDKPGRYEITVETYGPVVRTTPILLVVE